MPRFSPLVIYRSLWLLGIGAIVGVGVPYFGDPGTAMPLTARGRDSSINSGLNRALGAEDQASRIHDYLAQLPKDRPMAVLLPADHIGASYIACATSYLAWPRPTTLIWSPKPSRAYMEDLRAKYCATAWCYFPAPPDAIEVRRFGVGLTVVPNLEKTR